MTEPSKDAKRTAKKINQLAKEEGDLLSDGHLARIIQRLLDEKDAEIERLKNALAEVSPGLMRQRNH